MIALPLALKGFMSKYGIYLGIAVLVVGILLLVYCEGRSSGRSAIEAEQAIANVEAMQQDAGARENAAADRVADAEELIQLREELADVVAEIPDTVPDPVAVASGCDILRRQGKDTTAIPACAGR